MLFKTEQNSLTKCYFGMNTRCQFPPASAHSDPVHAGSLLFPALDSQHKLSPSWCSLPSQRYNLLANSFPGKSPSHADVPHGHSSAGIWGETNGISPPILPISWGARPEPSCIHEVPSRRSGMPCLGFPRPSRIFPLAITVVSNVFAAVRQLLGVGSPLEEQEAHGMGGAGRDWGAGNSRETPRQGSCRSPLAKVSLDSGKSLCPARCPPHRSSPHSCTMGGTEGTPRAPKPPLRPQPCHPGTAPHCH